MLPLLAAFQLAAAPPTWQVVDTRRWQWLPREASYTVRLEAERPAAPDSAGRVRLRIVVPGRRDFVYVDDRGDNPFEEWQKALARTAPATRNRLRPLGPFLAVVPAGSAHRSMLLAFGWAYEGSPHLLVAITTDSTGYPVLVRAEEAALIDILRLGERTEAWVMRPSTPEGIGDPAACTATYDPFHVWIFVPRGGRPMMVEDSAATEAYNREKYVWAGYAVREDVQVVGGCPGGPYTIKAAAP